MRFEAGDLVLVPFPFTDLPSVKARPALVLSNGSYNGSGLDVIACGVTSNLANASQSVLVTQDDMAEGLLPKPSRVKVGKIATLQQAIVRKRVGRLKARTVAQVRKELQSILG